MVPTNLPLFELAGKRLLPIIQGGMGVGVSAHRLAGAVAKEGAVGTVASIDLRHHHPDLLDRTRGCRDPKTFTEANLEALDREIVQARKTAGGNGLIAVNVMKAVAEHAAYVRRSCESGAEAIVMGAGLPVDLPELARDFPRVALVPIVSEIRALSIIVKRWLRKNRPPAAVVIEHPRFAGGHLGAPQRDEITDPRFDFSRVIDEAFQLFRELGLERTPIPLVPAGGINSFEKVESLLAAGASAAQVGTPFAVTLEGDAHPTYKKVLAEARPETIVTFVSTAGLPARAVLTPWLERYLKREPELQAKAEASPTRCASRLNCLAQCGLRDGISKMGQFCIDSHLAAALRGDLDSGLFFRGSESLPFGNAIRSVRELLDYLLNGRSPLPA